MAEPTAATDKAAKTDDSPLARFRADGTLPAQLTAAFLNQLNKKELGTLRKQFSNAPEGETREQKSRREKRLGRVETALAAK